MNSLNYAICKGCGKRGSKHDLHDGRGGIKPAELTFYNVSEDIGARPQPLYHDQECFDAYNGIRRDEDGFVVFMGPRYQVNSQ